MRKELLRMISWKVGIETSFTLSVGKNYKFIDKYISPDLWKRLLSTYQMDTYEHVWQSLFQCLQIFREVSGYVSEYFSYTYPEYDKNVTQYVNDMYSKYTI
jgi:aminoglycoside 6-adenylyltransferase